MILSPNIVSTAIISILSAMLTIEVPHTITSAPAAPTILPPSSTTTTILPPSQSSRTTTTTTLRSIQNSRSSTENYLPRKLYPGTYGQFCGPTPEVQVKLACSIHGWHGDIPNDQVDEACERHDIAYCHCEEDLLSRRRHSRRPQQQPLQSLTKEQVRQEIDEDLPMLSSMAALRFVTKPVLTKILPVDKAYFDCIHRADQEIIQTGIQVRSAMQQSGCTNGDPTLAWFCDLDHGTLNIFEKINLDIFLKDLDFDDDVHDVKDHKEEMSLQELEKRRQFRLSVELTENGKKLAEAASSGAVREIEQAMLNRLVDNDSRAL